MKKFIGKKVSFVMQGKEGTITCTVVEDSAQFIIGRTDRNGKDEVVYLCKSKVVLFMPLEGVDSEEISGLLVLYCENPSIGCPGVQCVKKGPGFTRSDLEAFMSPCPKKCKTCRAGSLGELRNIPGEKLIPIMDGTLYGDYPE